MQKKLGTKDQGNLILDRKRTMTSEKSMFYFARTKLHKQEPNTSCLVLLDVYLSD